MNIRYKKYIGMQEKNHQAIPMCATQHVIQVLNNSVCTVTWFKDDRTDGIAVASVGLLVVALLLRFASLLCVE